MTPLYKNLIIGLTALICITLIFIIHIAPSANSMINFQTEQLNTSGDMISNDYLTKVVDYHKTFPPFAKRPLTTFAIEKLSILTGLNIGYSFTIISFFFLFICGLLIAYISKLLENSFVSTVASVILFYLSFTILVAFFPRVYTYDEPLQYFFLLLSIIFLIKDKFHFFLITFFLALVARETTLLAIPSILYFLYSRNIFSKNYLYKVFGLFTTSVIYIVFLTILTSIQKIEQKPIVEILERLELLNYNFQDQQFSVESLTLIFLAIGLPLYLIYNYISTNPQLTSMEKKMYIAFFLLLIINTIIVLTTSRARENRLFALPLIFIWPLLGKYLLTALNPVKLLRLDTLLKPSFYSGCILALIISYFWAKKIYLQTGIDPATNFHNEYLFIYTLLILVHVLIKVNIPYNKKQ